MNDYNVYSSRLKDLRNLNLSPQSRACAWKKFKRHSFQKIAKVLAMLPDESYLRIERKERKQC